MDALYAHDHCDDLDFDARSQWVVGNGKQINVACSRQTKQAKSIKLATKVGIFLRDLDLDFANVYIWLVHLVFLSTLY